MTEKETVKWMAAFRKTYNGVPKEANEACDFAIAALGEIQKYRAIGTVEECRAAVEKMKPKKPVWKPIFEDDEDCKWWRCPTCNDTLTDRIPADNEKFYFHCLKCGQAFDWSEAECG